MKKFLSMVMAAAMTLSLVPATAFAADGVDLSATASIVGSESFTEGDVDPTTAEAQLKVTNSQYTGTAGTPDITFTLVLDNATFDGIGANNVVNAFTVRYYDAITATWSDLTQDPVDPAEGFVVVPQGDDRDEIDISIQNKELKKNDIIAVQLATTLDKQGNGKSAKVTVESDDIKISSGTDLTYATVGQLGFTASVRKTVDIAVEEVQTIEDITIKPAIGNTFTNNFVDNGDEITVRVSGGFEFTTANARNASLELSDGTAVANVTRDSDELVFTVTNAAAIAAADKLVLSGVELDAADAKEGATATLKIYVPGSDSVSVEVANVIGNAVTISVDEDADVPVFYSGTDLDNTGITNYTEHKSLEVTIKETFPGAWNVAKDWTLTLPEGVYAVTGTGDSMIVSNANVMDGGAAMTTADVRTWFEGAYDNGDYDNFTFKKRTWDVTDPTNDDDATEFSFKLYLVADPNFEGDVTLTLEGEAMDTQTVTIAKFVKPYTVEASQNDLQIDYRNTEVGSNIVIKEPEAGLWKKDTVIAVSLENISFDSGATVTPDEKSGMEVKNVRTNNGIITFTVDKVSTDEPATITVSDLDLYMERNLPAGMYDLSVYSPTMLGSDAAGDNNANVGYLDQVLLGGAAADTIDSVTDRFYDTVVKEGFINIVTAGREDADSFTTKLVIPIGSTTMTAGETQITLDAPAYISADGYTMLPLRAVATALGVPNESVLWDGATRTVTIMYGSKVIVMTVGQKTMYLNGSPVPASAAPEITNERTFLPVRDLGTALGVSDLTWDTDPATGKVSTVYVNANK